ncbi:MAG: histidine kinase [Methylovulum sp.]|nr:histidine kinase [Methylovulum sp.]
MNLKIQLMARIMVMGLLCLMMTAAYVLYQSHTATGQQAHLTADAIAKQLEFQLLRIDAGFGQAQLFPDFDLWKTFSAVPGTCVRFLATDGAAVRSACSGDGLLSGHEPHWFAASYRRLFQPGLEVRRPVSFNKRVYGSVSVTPSDSLEIARAFADLSHLLGLSAVTVLAVCGLVFFSIQRLLRPAQVIVAGLQKMQQGDLAWRLPDFALHEWRCTATAINQLVMRQQQLLDDHERLALKLLTVQEQERSFLAHELHDEFGQCLAAIHALTAAISQTAAQQCPELLTETEQIRRITQHIMDTLRGLLLRLRPADLDELGLSTSLGGLVQGWTARSHGKTVYHLDIHGDCRTLPAPLPMTVFRIVQECLTNIAKHAQASQVRVMLNIVADHLDMQIADNGVASQLPFSTSGIGLLGIQERVTALAGQLDMRILTTGGLLITLRLPIHQTQGTP